MHRNNLVKGLVLLVVALAAREYAHFTFFTSEMAKLIVYSQQDRPFVYRTFVPWLAYGLTRFGFSPETALSMVIACMAIGFLYALVFFFNSFRRS